MMANALSIDAVFHKLDTDLDRDATDWHLNEYYIHFQAERPAEEMNRSNIDQRREHQSQAVSTSILAPKQDAQADRHPSLFHDIPDYLTAASSSFQVTFFADLRSYHEAIAFEDLQALAFLTHQISILHLHQQLWQRCLLSGTGQIIPPRASQSTSLLLAQDPTETEITPPPPPPPPYSFWPNFVLSMMRSQGLWQPDQDQKTQHDMCVRFVRSYLTQLEQKAHQYRLQFETLEKRLPRPHTKEMFNQKLDQFVQNKGLLAMRLHFEARIALIKYICLDRSYQLEYLQQTPTPAQVEIANRICRLTFDREKTQQELVLFQFDLLYKKLPKFLDLSETPLPTSITTISDRAIRERLSDDYTSIVQRATYELTNVLRSATEAKRSDSQKRFDQETAEIWRQQRQLPTSERLTTTMVTFIEARQTNIIECLKSIYHLKGELYHRAAPTTTATTTMTAGLF